MRGAEHTIIWRGRAIPYSIRRHGKCIYTHVSVLVDGKVDAPGPPGIRRDRAADHAPSVPEASPASMSRN